MFDNYVLSENGFKNREENGKIVGYEMKTLIPYYRGIPLSMIHDVKISVDGQEIDKKDILFTLDNEYFFTLDEMETVTSFKWEYGTEATVIVKKDGGLTKGKHEIRLEIVIRVSYIPVPFEGIGERVFEIV
ncbi:MAG: hypothetical protein JXM74_05320 [Fusobacteriaceae bacterium]|nr:hypothetical protein [Fusobacteriaceae bacterium]MBN2838157.1 hypothetical protein [Fusobacteriaceae bacterium]